MLKQDILIKILQECIWHRIRKKNHTRRGAEDRADENIRQTGRRRYKKTE